MNAFFSDGIRSFALIHRAFAMPLPRRMRGVPVRWREADATERSKALLHVDPREPSLLELLEDRVHAVHRLSPRQLRDLLRHQLDGSIARLMVAVDEPVQEPDAEVRQAARGTSWAVTPSMLRSQREPDVADPPQLAPPLNPAEPIPVPELLGWIEIELVDRAGWPQAFEAYEVTGPDGICRSGMLDDNGFARVQDLPSGECLVCFPRLDRRLWRRRS